MRRLAEVTVRSPLIKRVLDWTMREVEGKEIFEVRERLPSTVREVVMIVEGEEMMALPDTVRFGMRRSEGSRVAALPLRTDRVHVPFTHESPDEFAIAGH